MVFFPQGNYMFPEGSLLITMFVLAFISVISRLCFNVCFVGCIDVVQNMVLWCTFLGGSIGARKNKHLSINVFHTLFKGRLKTIITVSLYVIVSIISAFLAWSGYRFCLSQHEFGETLPTLGVKLWKLQLILPYTFTIVSLRYLLEAIRKIRGVGTEDEDAVLGL